MRRAALSLFLFVCVATVLGAGDPCRLTPASARQGGVVLVTVALDAQRVDARWFGEYHALRHSDGVWWALLPIPVTAPAGARPVAVRVTESGGRAHELIRTVTIMPLKRAVQRLRVSAQTNALYSAAEAKAERAAIGGAIRADTGPADWPGPFTLPFQGRTTTAFGTRRIRNGEEVDWHRGLDLAAPEGTPVHAPAAGAVALVAEDYKLHGKTIVLAHGGGLATVYLHLSRIEVARGDSVTAGQVIGRVGKTGAATGPHLHWAAYLNGDAVNPLALADLPESLP